MRDLILVLLLYGLGLRLGELRRLRWNDLHYSREIGYHFVIRAEASKGAYSGGLAPLTDEMVTWLRRWAAVRERYAPVAINPYIIVADLARSQLVGRGRPISESAVQRRIKRLFHQMGLDSERLGSVHPHRFRHSFAVEHLMDNNDIKSVALLLRHKSPQTTLTTYSNFTDCQLAEKAREHNPLNEVFNSQRFPTSNGDRIWPE